MVPTARISSRGEELPSCPFSCVLFRASIKIKRISGHTGMSCVRKHAPITEDIESHVSRTAKAAGGRGHTAALAEPKGPRLPRRDGCGVRQNGIRQKIRVRMWGRDPAVAVGL